MTPRLHANATSGLTGCQVCVGGQPLAGPAKGPPGPTAQTVPGGARGPAETAPAPVGAAPVPVGDAETGPGLWGEPHYRIEPAPPRRRPQGLPGPAGTAGVEAPGDEGHAPPAPDGPEAARVLQVLESIAGLQTSDPDASLLGLASIKLVELAHHLRLATGKSIGLLDLMHLSVRQLVARVASFPLDTAAPGTSTPLVAGLGARGAQRVSWFWFWNMPCAWLFRLPAGAPRPVLQQALRRLVERHPQLTARPVQPFEVANLAKEVAGLISLWALRDVSPEGLRCVAGVLCYAVPCRRGAVPHNAVLHSAV